MSQKEVSASFFGATDIGNVRKNNEDNYIACRIWDGSYLLLAAIDGIGGYEGGEVAAEIARDEITGIVSSHQGEDCLELLKRAVTAANNSIVEHKKADASRSHMGCVLSSAIISLKERRLYMVHVGDSRLYQFTPQEGLKKLSHDHSLVGYREEMGLLTEEEAMTHPQRNIIERSLGEEFHEPDDRNFLDAGIFPIFSSTQFLFCSDGLSDMLYSAEIAEVLSRKMTVENEASTLIDLAKEAGGKDNITVVIANIDIPQQISTSAPGNSISLDSESEFRTIDNDDDLIADDGNSNMKHVYDKPLATAKGKSFNFRRFNYMIIAIALSFIVGGTVGYFIGRQTTLQMAEESKEALQENQDVVVDIENEPDSTFADPHRLGEQTADTINRQVREQIENPGPQGNEQNRTERPEQPSSI